jgi:uncharacterized membrane protein YdjX (TVP38/TMEM64 family)
MTPIQRLTRFFTEMDSTAARAVWIAFALFTIAGMVVAGGMLFLDLDQGAVSDFLRSLRDVWWSPAAVTATFVVLAFVGAPQVVLIAATVAVFGPAEGMVLSWVATMISASVGYAIGRIGGASALGRLLGGRGGRVLRFIGNNGFLASLVIRLVPSGPFIIVNMALGAARVGSMAFAGGTGIGIWPKIALVAFGAHGLDQVLRGDNLAAMGFFAAAAIVWVLIAFIVRPLLRGQGSLQALVEPDDEAEGTAPPRS